MTPCCQTPRISIIKRWTFNQVFYSIERCRRCNKWWRREVSMKFEKGRISDETNRIDLKISTPKTD